MMADLMAAGDQSGWELLSKAAMPLTWGQDIEVPDRMLNGDIELGFFAKWRGHAARMLTPGPIISGFKIPRLSSDGPLEENEATLGGDDFSITVPLNKIVAIGFEVEFIYY